MFFIFRTLVTLALLYGVYTETGIWTAITLGLICVAMEGSFHAFERKGRRSQPHKPKMRAEKQH
jgi:hypothetical protein